VRAPRSPKPIDRRWWATGVAQFSWFAALNLAFDATPHQPFGSDPVGVWTSGPYALSLILLTTLPAALYFGLLTDKPRRIVPIVIALGVGVTLLPPNWALTAALVFAPLAATALSRTGSWGEVRLRLSVGCLILAGGATWSLINIWMAILAFVMIEISSAVNSAAQRDSAGSPEEGGQSRLGLASAVVYSWRVMWVAAPLGWVLSALPPMRNLQWGEWAWGRVIPIRESLDTTFLYGVILIWPIFILPPLLVTFWLSQRIRRPLLSDAVAGSGFALVFVLSAVGPGLTDRGDSLLNFPAAIVMLPIFGILGSLAWALVCGVRRLFRGRQRA